MALVLATLVIAPSWQASPVYKATYVETLAAHDADASEMTRPDLPEDLVEEL